ncbi:large conductance mechanosensitive channel protein MscL [Gordonia sp. NPDC003424]
MLKGFKEFILKGNVVELATAVIVGAAFTAIVTAFTTSIIAPIFAAIPTGNSDCGGGTTVEGTEGAVQGPVSTCGFGFRIVADNPATFMDFGALLAAVINFLIIAAVVYFLIIAPYNKLAELGGFGKKAEVTEVSLLTEIRDLLDPEGSSKAKEAAEEDLPDHLKDPSGPPSGGAPAAAPLPNDPGVTQRLTTPPPAAAPQSPPPQSVPPQSAPPQSAPRGYPTPPPAPGNYPPPGTYPPPGNYPPGNFPPQQYPGDHSDGPGRHSR